MDIQDKLLSHPVYKHYLALLGSAPEETIRPRFTGSVIVGPTKIGLRSPLLFVIDDKFLERFDDMDGLKPGERNSSYTFFFFGEELTGHPNIVHGGLLATCLDEVTCRLAFQNCHSRKGVTANLNINYRRPCYANSYILLKSTILKKKGRKTTIKGEIYLLDLERKWLDIEREVETPENLLCECETLCIEPKWVDSL